MMTECVAAWIMEIHSSVKEWYAVLTRSVQVCIVVRAGDAIKVVVEMSNVRTYQETTNAMELNVSKASSVSLISALTSPVPTLPSSLISQLVPTRPWVSFAKETLAPITPIVSAAYAIQNCLNATLHIL